MQISHGGELRGYDIVGSILKYLFETPTSMNIHASLHHVDTPNFADRGPQQRQVSGRDAEGILESIRRTHSQSDFLCMLLSQLTSRVAERARTTVDFHAFVCVDKN